MVIVTRFQSALGRLVYIYYSALSVTKAKYLLELAPTL